MNAFKVFLMIFLLVFSTLFSTAGMVRGDSGTLKLSWDEFRTGSRDLGGIVLKGGLYDLDKGDEWTKVKVKFDLVNKGSDGKKVRYIICIFDKTQNMIFASSDDKELGQFETEDVSCKAKISSKILFDPETVYIRLWWE
jgi:hypothetical protein